MNPIGILIDETLSFQWVHCQLIIEENSKLKISDLTKMNRDRISDLSTYGYEAKNVLLGSFQDAGIKFHYMSMEEMTNASKTIPEILPYLRDEKIETICKLD